MALRLKRSSQKDEFRRFPRLAIFRAKIEYRVTGPGKRIRVGELGTVYPPCGTIARSHC